MGSVGSVAANARHKNLRLTCMPILFDKKNLQKEIMKKLKFLGVSGLLKLKHQSPIRALTAEEFLKRCIMLVGIWHIH